MRENLNSYTLVLGASPLPHRYSYMAAQLLQKHGFKTLLVGRRQGFVDELPIMQYWPENVAIDTITMYLSAANQEAYYAEILGSGARRIIFNPGAENEELAGLARAKNIEVEEACTLVMIATNQF